MGIFLRSIGSVEAPVIFAGYGVKTPDGSYDDYAGIDVKGKIVTVLVGGPSKLPSVVRAHLSTPFEKARLARDKGAIAPATSESLFRNAPKSWDATLQDAKDSKAQGFALPMTMRLHAVVRPRDVTSPNVVAVLPGSDPSLKSEYVAYTAHSDHLGVGKPVNGDDIYNGAGDNASGVAALLEIARAFRSLPNPPARSILFLAVTAEEMGLLGSDYFAHYPTVPIQSIVANVNMDEASISYAFKDVVPRGAPDSTLGPLVERAASQWGLKVSPDPQPEQGYFTRSDQYSFVQQGIPSAAISEGFEAKDPRVDGKKLTGEWTATRYHKPSDDMSRPMDLNASLQFMQLHFLVGYEIANEPEKPRWNPGDFFGETFGRKAKP